MRHSAHSTVIHVHLPAPTGVFAVIALAALVALCLTIVVQVALRRRRGLVTRPVHVAQRAHYHLPLPVLVVSAGLLTVGAGTTIAIGLNSRPDLLTHLRPDPRIVAAGAGLPASYNAENLAPRTIVDQGSHNECGSVLTVESIVGGERRRGEIPPWMGDPYQLYVHVQGGVDTNGYTTLEGNRQAVEADGISNGGRTVYPGLRVSYLFSEHATAADLAAIKWTVWTQGHAGILVEYRAGMNAGFYGTSHIVNDGPLLGYHFMYAFGWQGDNLLVRQSYGTRYGTGSAYVAGGDFVLDASSIGTIVEAADIEPGPTRIWSTPVPTATPRPTATPTKAAPIRPTARPSATRTHLAPAPRHTGPGPYRHMVRGQYLRPRPAVVPTGAVFVPRGSTVKLWGPAPRDRRWLHVTYHGHMGYVATVNTSTR